MRRSLPSDPPDAWSPAPPASASLGPLWPGIAAAVAVAGAARILHTVAPDSLVAPIGEVVIAVVLGALVANVVHLPASLARGVRLCVSTVLRAAVVLLGARLSLGQVVAIGGEAVGMIVVLMTVALLGAHALGRLTRTPPTLATLVGVGVSVCGNSAIVATAPVIGASDDDVSAAIAVNTVFGTAAVLCYPLIGAGLGLGSAAYGTWVGTAVNDTSQVLAAGFAYGTAAGQVATTVKLARNALMGPVIVAMGLLHAGLRGAAVTDAMTLVRRSLPLFVLGFLAMALGNSLGVFASVTAATGVPVQEVLTAAARLLLLVALAAVGLGTSAAALRRSGWRPFAVGLAAATVTSGASLMLIGMFGPAGT